MKKISISLANLTRKSSRTAVLVLLVALLAGSLFAGAVVTKSLNNGLESVNARLGADIICIPTTAKSKVNVEQLLLTGTTGYFYMDAKYADQLAQIDGVEKISSQVYLASMRADCCSTAIQVIGIDQETDFVVQPWIAECLNREMKNGELVVGSRVTSGVGEDIRIYGLNCPVVARLAPTSTAMDTAVYCTMETLRVLLEAAQGLGHDLKIGGDPADVVSCVYIKVKPSVDVQSVTDDINVHVRKVKASSTRSMLSGVSESLDGVSGTISMLITVVWVLIFMVLLLAFTLLSNERKREFAVLRVIGMSRAGLVKTALCETFLVCLIGGMLGLMLGAVIVFPFSTLIEMKLNLPYLMPDWKNIAQIAILSFSSVMVVAPLASVWSVIRLSCVDAGTVLREGN